MRSIPERPRVGVAANGFFTGAPDELARLEEVAKGIGHGRISLRLHPTTQLHREELEAGRPWLEVRPLDESIDGFAASIDLAVVGNSAVQLRLLQLGVPVLHMNGFDPLGFDLYGYVRDGFVLGLPPEPSSLGLDEVRHFFQNTFATDDFNALTSVTATRTLPDLGVLGRPCESGHRLTVNA